MSNKDMEKKYAEDGADAILMIFFELDDVDDFMKDHFNKASHEDRKNVQSLRATAQSISEKADKALKNGQWNSLPGYVDEINNICQKIWDVLPHGE